jgi:phosphate transport system substrate-binding protein
MKTWKLAWLSAIVVLLSLAGHQTGVCQEKQIIKVSGALPLTDLVNAWAADYMKSKPGSQVTVFGKTAGYGYTQFLDGDANLIMATRKMTEEERQRAAAKGIRLAEKYVMNIPIAILTNPKNPVASLTLDQLRGVYSGGISNWKDLGGPDEAIKVTQRPYPDTGAAVLFKDEILKDLDYRKDALIMSSFKNMVHICEQSMAIGFMPNTGVFCDPSKYHIKLMTLKKDASSQPTSVSDADYPLIMPFFFAWDANSPSKEVEEFVHYAVEKAKEMKPSQGSGSTGAGGK